MFSLKSEKIPAVFLLVFAAIIFGAAVSGAAQVQPVCTKFQNYRQLDAERTKVQKAITESETKINILKDKIKNLENLTAQRDALTNEINELGNKPENADKLQDLKVDLQTQDNKIKVASEGKSQQDLAGEVKKLEDELPKKQAELDCVNKQFDEWTSPEADFKRTMSAVFAFLIFLVIAGFFWVAIVDNKVRQAVFAGQVGLQFIALFSIVIAIILFGITGILEAKELSALLGSLAGYILGRTMSNPSGTGDGGAAGAAGSGNAAAGGGDFAGKVVSVKVTPSTLNLDTAKPSEKLTATLEDAAGQALVPPTGASAVQWKSSDSTVATVDADGVVTRLKAGTTNITATFNSISSNDCVVTCI